MKEVLEEELAIVETYIAFLDRFRTRGGLLFIPDDLIPDNDTSFEEELIQALTTPVEDTTDRANFLPFIIRGPEALFDKVKPIEFDNEFRKTLCARAYDIKGRIQLLDKKE